MATFDRRRVQAPESVPLQYDAPLNRIRDDDIFLNTGLVTQANGSAYIESGTTKIACSVYGPRPRAPPYSAQGSLNVELKFAPFASDPRRAPLRDTEPAALSTILTQLLLPALQLHLLPKSTIDVFLLVLESDSVSGVLEAGLTAASAAVADAGIPMDGLALGSSAGEGARVTVGALPALNKLTSLWMMGSVDIDEACTIIGESMAKSKARHGIVAQALLE